ncbi:phosphotransferase [Paenibacillus harenae]|uniref:phosphotransferase n=1 Tax=Paenibacillus harenae TaxID=306543 RepID=UPI00278ECB57|nr:phosphotransferase [Paenibacillus harenae]MDQ0057983.1 homoserine kinase type II [Paenibacillus harenae]
MDSIDFASFLEQYSFKDEWRIEHKESGMNNTTRMVTAGNERFVMRIYNNHKDSGIVALEHEILDWLQTKALPFQVPLPIHNGNGTTLTRIEDGTIASLFRYIEGERTDAATERHVYLLGRAAGELSAALSDARPSRQPLYSPYYELEETYAAMDEESFINLSERSNELLARRESMTRLMNERRYLKPLSIRIAELPKQWIHGDLVFNNTLVRDGAMSGVLDFEFCTVDVRAMELAVTAVDMIRPDRGDLLDRIKLLFAGYSEVIRLSDREMELLPAMMKLRLLDVALHFAIRFKDGLDADEVLCGIIDQSVYGCEWVERHADGLLRQLRA